jgi:hypothetical protein
MVCRSFGTAFTMRRTTLHAGRIATFVPKWAILIIPASTFARGATIKTVGAFGAMRMRAAIIWHTRITATMSEASFYAPLTTGANNLRRTA